jgi:hypothetical protein
MLAQLARRERLSLLKMKRMTRIGQRTTRVEAIGATGALDEFLTPAFLFRGSTFGSLLDEPFLSLHICLELSLLLGERAFFDFER